MTLIWSISSHWCGVLSILVKLLWSNCFGQSAGQTYKNKEIFSLSLLFSLLSLLFSLSLSLDHKKLIYMHGWEKCAANSTEGEARRDDGRKFSSTLSSLRACTRKKSKREMEQRGKGRTSPVTEFFFATRENREKRCGDGKRKRGWLKC